MTGLSQGIPRVGADPVATRWLARAVPLYVAAICAAEATTAFLGETTGAIVHGGLLLLLLTHYVVVQGTEPNRESATSAEPASALPALALVPLLRILSLTTPVEDVSRLWWYAMAGAPLLLGALLMQRLPGLSLAEVTLAPRRWGLQLVIALSGVPLGLAAYEVAQPDQIVTDPAAVELVLGSLSLFVFSGLTEELVFRGLIQRSLEVTLRPLAGLLLANGLFAASYLGTQSASYVLLIAGVGLAFGLCMWRTGSIAGIGIAHGLLSVGAVLVWPYLLG